MEELYKKYGEGFVDSILLYIPHIIAAIAIFFIGSWLIKMINKAVYAFFQRKEYDEGLETFIQSFISVILRLVLIILIITQLGVETSSLIAMLGAAGLAIGLALQGSLANFAGGVLILLFKPFKVGIGSLHRDWMAL